MKLSINVLLFTALFLFMGFNADAQRRGGPPNAEEMANKQTEHMTEELSLSTDQVAKVEAINLDYAKRIQAAREENAGNRSAMKEIMTAIENEKAAEMKTVLTEDQYKSFEEMQANQAKPKGRRGGNRGSKT